MTRREKIEKVLWPRGEDHSVFAILDGARNRSIYSKILNSYRESDCLYAGSLSPVLEAAAPHLVRLELGDKLTNELLDEGWGDSWGIYLRAYDSFGSIRRHFRRFLRVQDETGRKLVFRYYDPRVLRSYLPTCLPDEIDFVFREVVDGFWLEDADPSVMLEFKRDRRALKTARIEV